MRASKIRSVMRGFSPEGVVLLILSATALGTAFAVTKREKASSSEQLTRYLEDVPISIENRGLVLGDSTASSVIALFVDVSDSATRRLVLTLDAAASIKPTTALHVYQVPNRVASEYAGVIAALAECTSQTTGFRNFLLELDSASRDTTQQFEDWLLERITAPGIRPCAESPIISDRIARSRREASKVGITQIPAALARGRVYQPLTGPEPLLPVPD